METALSSPAIRLRRLPISLPTEGGIRLELREGILVLKASTAVQERIESLIDKQREHLLSKQEEEELEIYEEFDDYLSLLNRLTRNLYVEAGNN